MATDCPTPWKVPHLSRAKANAHLVDLKKKQSNKQSRSQRLPIEVYPCGGHFHVGHPPRTRRG